MATQTMAHHGDHSQTTIRVRTVLRLILGAIFFIMGLNGFFNFLPMPQMSGEAATFMKALGMSGYFFPLLKTVETLSGLALLANKFSHVAIVALLPVTVNIFFFHLFLAPSGILMGIIVLAVNIALIALYFDIYKPLLRSVIEK